MDILLCDNFTHDEWIALTMDPDPYVRSYAYLNKNCPSVIRERALYEKNPGVLSSALDCPDPPRALLAFASQVTHWAVRQVLLERKVLDWASLERPEELIPMYEKLALFGRKDCPEWMLRIMWKLPPQRALDGNGDINDRLRDIAERRLDKADMLTAEERAEIEARKAASR